MSESDYDFVSHDNKIRKKLLEGGVKGCRPTEMDECRYLIDDSPAENVIVLGEYDTEHERLLERCISTMDLREKSKFWFLDSEVILYLAAYTKMENIDDMSDESKLNLAYKHKEKGVALYKNGRIDDAFSRFHRSLKLICFAEKTELYDIVCSNIALCLLKKKRYEHAVTVCTKVLSRNKNIKCLLRRAVALKNLKDFEKSSEDLHAVLEIEPNNKEATTELNFVNIKLHEMNSKYKNMCKKIFSYS